MPASAPEAETAARSVALAGPTDFDGFRRHARRLLAEGVAPAAVEWRVADAAAGDLFARPAMGDDDAVRAAAEDDAPPSPRVDVPAAFVALCADAVLHRDPNRFGLLYRLLWRLLHEPALRHDPLDADRMQAERMAQAVRRDLHKMKAFVRFRRLAAPTDAAEEVQADDAALHVAWYEPEHHIVEAAAPFFARRFTAMRWAILTPDCSVHWDGRDLHLGPGARREDAPPADAGERLWLTYYAHTFNPARLKLAAMQREMPRKFWPNLPEARLIGPLAAAAHERSARMVERPATAPLRRIPHSATGLAPRTTTAPIDEREAAMAALRDAAARCRDCPLHRDATQTVFGEGPLDAALMLVGEQPGDREDLRGRPFVGPAGQLLDRALAELGWSRERLYLTNAVKHFKFELRGQRRIHRSPAEREADACRHWLDSEIALLRPRAVVALGATAARRLLGRPVAVLRERGRWIERADGLRVLVTLHPSALLRTPLEARDAALRQWLDDLRLASPYAAVSAAPA